jgi:hypothetical protein
MMDLALLNAEIANGMYKTSLAPEVPAVIVQSWRNFGLLPAATIEEMVPEKTICTTN